MGKSTYHTMGGEHFLSSGEKINMYHTCTIDNFLQILLVFYSLNIEQMQNLVSSVDPLFTTLCEVIQLLLTSDFYGAKYHWLTKLCDLSPTSGNKILNSFGTDKQLIMYPLWNTFLQELPVRVLLFGVLPVRQINSCKR